MAVVIPDKLYFRIGAVSELTGLEAYVLRYWEKEFPMLRPVKSSPGHRMYRRKDVELLLEIKRLLYKEGFTIEGARKKLRADARQQKLEFPGAERQKLIDVRRELHDLVNLLK
jgi:DNA-binding transcriptional MerR regulator